MPVTTFDLPGGTSGGVTLVMAGFMAPNAVHPHGRSGEKHLLLRLQGGVHSPAMFGTAQAGSATGPEHYLIAWRVRLPVAAGPLAGHGRVHGPTRLPGQKVTSDPTSDPDYPPIIPMTLANSS